MLDLLVPSNPTRRRAVHHAIVEIQHELGRRGQENQPQSRAQVYFDLELKQQEVPNSLAPASADRDSAASPQSTKQEETQYQDVNESPQPGDLYGTNRETTKGCAKRMREHFEVSTS